MTSISFSIMAHPLRQYLAEGLADELARQGHPNPVTICYDTDDAGEVLNGDRAWQQAKDGTNWHVVLQDDAMLQPHSLAQMHAALGAVRGVRLISFYVGTGRPRQKAVQGAFQRADRSGAAWLESPDLLWGVGVAMPTRCVGVYLRWSAHAGKRTAYDRRLGSFARQHDMPVLYTWPSLVDHLDGPSLLDHPWGAPVGQRIAYRLGTRDNWATHTERI